MYEVYSKLKHGKTQQTCRLPTLYQTIPSPSPELKHCLVFFFYFYARTIHFRSFLSPGISNLLQTFTPQTLKLYISLVNLWYIVNNQHIFLSSGMFRFDLISCYNLKHHRVTCQSYKFSKRYFSNACLSKIPLGTNVEAWFLHNLQLILHLGLCHDYIGLLYTVIDDILVTILLGISLSL